MTHALKTQPEYYRAVESGEKPFEVRKHDRPFKVGDIVLLQEYDAEKGVYTGREMTRKISYILKGEAKFGLLDSFSVLGLQPII
jgi:hypothetical protein